jgi:pimeloyl-ACP methyl ester carboxylesterase
MWHEVDEAAERRGLRIIAPDRPGIGSSTFRRYTVVSYADELRSFVDTLGIGRFAIIGQSGGGRYGYACAWRMPDRVTRLVSLSSTSSPDLAGTREAWSKEDRQVYRLASRIPWALDLYLRRLRRTLETGGTSELLDLFPAASPPDAASLAREDVRELLRTAFLEALRQGPRGVRHDYALEGRPWGFPLREIDVPVEIWHGEDDRVVSPEQARILANGLAGASTHFLDGEGHFSIFIDRLDEIFDSVG